MGKPKFYISGQPVKAPRNWDQIEVLATFDNNGVQANITTDSLNFVNETAQTITDYLAGGGTDPITTKGIFEGLPFMIDISESSAVGVPTTQVFKGIIDTMKSRIIAPNEVEVEIKDQKGLDKLQFKAEGLTFGLMKDKGHITASDYSTIPYVVQKKQDLIAEAVLALSIYTLTVELQKQIEETAAVIADSIAHASGGISGPVAAAIWLAAKIALRLVLIGVMIVQIINLVNKMLEFLAPRVKYFKGMNLRTMLEKGATYMDYTFSSTIADLDKIFMLPSKELEGNEQVFLNPPNNDTGIPRTGDNGYIYVELLEAVKIAFNAKFIVDSSNVIHLESLNNDAFWINQSTYQKPDVLVEKYRFNTDELSATNVVSFNYDIQDQWSLDRFKGTVYEIKTEALQIGEEQNVLLGGYNESRIPYALGTRKDDFTKVEEALLSLAQIADAIINFFPIGNSNLTGTITQKIGMLRISEDLVNVPKWLVLENVQGQFKIPSNHRDILSAKSLWEKYINKQSFVDNNFGNQYRIYEGVKVPFTLVDFLKLIQNSYFYDTDGQSAKVDKISWVMGDDTAEIDYRVRDVYSRNLTETKILPGQNV